MCQENPETQSKMKALEVKLAHVTNVLLELVSYVGFQSSSTVSLSALEHGSKRNAKLRTSRVVTSPTSWDEDVLNLLATLKNVEFSEVTQGDEWDQQAPPFDKGSFNQYGCAGVVKAGTNKTKPMDDEHVGQEDEDEDEDVGEEDDDEDVGQEDDDEDVGQEDEDLQPILFPLQQELMTVGPDGAFTMESCNVTAIPIFPISPARKDPTLAKTERSLLIDGHQKGGQELLTMTQIQSEPQSPSKDMDMLHTSIPSVKERTTVPVMVQTSSGGLSISRMDKNILAAIKAEEDDIQDNSDEEVGVPYTLTQIREEPLDLGYDEVDHSPAQTSLVQVPLDDPVPNRVLNFFNRQHPIFSELPTRHRFPSQGTPPKLPPKPSGSFVNPFQCSSTSSILDLRSHLAQVSPSASFFDRLPNTPTKTEPVTCPLCTDGQKFTTKGVLARHVKNMHSDVPTLVSCSQCSRKFKYNEGLRYHIQSVHEGKRHLCGFDRCASAYSTVTALRKHQRVKNHGKDSRIIYLQERRPKAKYEPYCTPPRRRKMNL